MASYFEGWFEKPKLSRASVWCTAIQDFLESFNNESSCRGCLLVSVWWYSVLFQIGLYLLEMRVLYFSTGEELAKQVAAYWTPVSFELARWHSIHSATFKIAKKIAKTAILTGLIKLGVFLRLWQWAGTVSSFLPLWDEHVWRIVVFGSFLVVLHRAFKILFSLYHTQVIQEIYGFKRGALPLQTFLMENVKDVFYSILFFYGPVIGRLANQKLPDSSATGFWSLVISIARDVVWVELYIVVFDLAILPHLVKGLLPPLPPSSLKQRVDALANRVSFPSANIRVYPASATTAGINAGFYGYLWCSHIIIWDTLLIKTRGFNWADPGFRGNRDNSNNIMFTEREVTAILAHELGHWNGMHTIKGRVASRLFGGAVLWLLAYLLGGDIFSPEYRNILRVIPFIGAFKPFLDRITTAAIPTSQYQNIADPLLSSLGFLVGVDDLLPNYYGQLLEYASDRFAVELRLGRDAQIALIKLERYHLSFPLHNFLYGKWYRSHPSVVQRVAEIERLMRG